MNWESLTSKILENNNIYWVVAVVLIVCVFFLFLVASKKLRKFLLNIVDKVKSLSIIKTKEIKISKNENKPLDNAPVVKDNNLTDSEIKEISSNSEVVGNTLQNSKIGYIGSRK